MGYLKIGQLAKLTETNNETLRFYESEGLLEQPRRSDSGYRLYTGREVARVQFIVRARRMGFSLKEISELLSMQVDKASTTCGEVKEMAEARLADIEGKIAELNLKRHTLQRITESCCGGNESAIHCTILNSLEA